MIREPLTFDEVEDRLEEAADTLIRLPDPHRHKRLRSHWPTVIQQSTEAYGYGEARVRLGPPPAAAIDRMEEVFGWLVSAEIALTPDQQRLLWARANGVEWKLLAQRIWLLHKRPKRYDRNRLRHHQRAALRRIVEAVG